MNKLNRKQFLTASSLGIGSLLLPPKSFGRSLQQDTEPIKPEIVKEFVGASHGKFDRSKELMDEFPNLLFSAWDWGNGDFETGFEAAGHVGNKKIANYMIEKGARLNIFVMAMLGKTNIVKSILEEYPHLLNTAGAHGFTLLHHAKRGGDDSLELYEYFQEKGLKEMKIKIK
ncbi:MAG: ankyrin repeat domain-containing protein [Saprospiraceae bacterium]